VALRIGLEESYFKNLCPHRPKLRLDSCDGYVMIPIRHARESPLSTK
jgi:hypothetical protein